MKNEMVVGFINWTFGIESYPDEVAKMKANYAKFLQYSITLFVISILVACGGGASDPAGGLSGLPTGIGGRAMPVSSVITGSLVSGREGHTATLLSNGLVLVVGGVGSGVGPSGQIFLASAELYDPATSTWSATGSLAVARAYHTATLLPNGQVLVSGGMNYATGYVASVELYDPVTGIWKETTSLGMGRYGHTATLLPDGKVMVTGGRGENLLGSTELYDSSTGIWSASGSLVIARSWHTATLLPNGRVLIAGGYGAAGTPAVAELYDPSLGTMSMTGSLATARYGHSATLLSDGKVLVAGGNDGVVVLASTELYDPLTGIWGATGSLAVARGWHTATLMGNGQMLVMGGFGLEEIGTSVVEWDNYLASVEVFDPLAGTWSVSDTISTAERYGHTATLLANGQALIAGGYGEGNVFLASALVYW